MGKPFYKGVLQVGNFSFIKAIVYTVKELNLIDVNVTVHDCIDSKCRHTLETEFIGDVLSMGDNRRKTDIQFIGDFLVYIAPDDQGEHLYLPVAEYPALKDGWHRWQVASTAVAHLHYHEHLLHQSLFRLIDAETVEAGQLTVRIAGWGHNQGTVHILLKEVEMPQNNTLSHKEMDEVIRPCSLKGLKAPEVVDIHYRNHVLQNLFQSENCKHIAVYDRHLWAPQRSSPH